MRARAETEFGDGALTPLRLALRARQIQLADDASRTVTRALIDASEVLNPAQRGQLATYFARGRRFT